MKIFQELYYLLRPLTLEGHYLKKWGAELFDPKPDSKEHLSIDQMVIFVDPVDPGYSQNNIFYLLEGANVHNDDLRRREVSSQRSTHKCVISPYPKPSAGEVNILETYSNRFLLEVERGTRMYTLPETSLPSLLWLQKVKSPKISGGS